MEPSAYIILSLITPKIEYKDCVSLCIINKYFVSKIKKYLPRHYIQKGAIRGVYLSKEEWNFFIRLEKYKNKPINILSVSIQNTNSNLVSLFYSFYKCSKIGRDIIIYSDKKNSYLYWLPLVESIAKKKCKKTYIQTPGKRQYYKINIKYKKINFTVNIVYNLNIFKSDINNFFKLFTLEHHGNNLFIYYEESKKPRHKINFINNINLSEIIVTKPINYYLSLSKDKYNTCIDILKAKNECVVLTDSNFHKKLKKRMNLKVFVLNKKSILDKYKNYTGTKVLIVRSYNNIYIPSEDALILCSSCNANILNYIKDQNTCFHFLFKNLIFHLRRILFFYAESTYYQENILVSLEYLSFVNPLINSAVIHRACKNIFNIYNKISLKNLSRNISKNIDEKLYIYKNVDIKNVISTFL